MNSDREQLNESEIDALAVKMLDYYDDGQYAYDSNTNKTVKQRNMKRYIKDNLNTMNKDANKNIFLNAFYDTTMEINQPTKLREEVILLKKKLIIYETRDENYEALAMTLHKDEIYKRVKSEMDEGLLQNLKDSRWVNQQQSDIIGKLERSLSEKSNYVPRERLQELQEHNHKLTCEIHKNKKNHKMSAKEKKRAALRKQMEALDSSDDDEIEIIKVDIDDSE